RAEREPANAAAIAAESQSNSPVRTADESDKCRAIYRTRIVRTRAPAPAAADVRPTPVVEGGKSPRRIVDPRPSPGTDVVPVTVTVRCPAYVDGGRIPYRAVVRLFVPSAIVIEIAISGHVARDVARGHGTVFLSIAIVCPAIKSVWSRRRGNKIRDVIRAVELAAFSGGNRVCLVICDDLTFAANRGYARAVAVFIHIHPKCARLRHIERDIWSVHFVDIAFAQFTDPEIDRSLSKAHLRCLVIKIQKRQRRHAGNANGSLTGLKFGAGIVVRPDFVANCNGAVASCLAPLALPAGLK